MGEGSGPGGEAVQGAHWIGPGKAGGAARLCRVVSQTVPDEKFRINGNS